VGTGLENPARYGEQIYYRSSDALWVNLYIASTLRWEEAGVELRQETRFPDEETVRFLFTCKTSQTCALRFRHPYWCANPEVKLNGEPVTVDSTPSSYMTFERIWKTGDTIELRLPMTLRPEPLPHSEENIFAVMYGPTVLAAVVPDEPGIPSPSHQRFSEHLNARGKTDSFPPLMVAENVEDFLSHLKPTGKAFAEFRSEGVVKPSDPSRCRRRVARGLFHPRRGRRPMAVACRHACVHRAASSRATHSPGGVAAPAVRFARLGSPNPRFPRRRPPLGASLGNAAPQPGSPPQGRAAPGRVAPLRLT
jgi:hypothetical protein